MKRIGKKYFAWLSLLMVALGFAYFFNFIELRLYKKSATLFSSKLKEHEERLQRSYEVLAAKNPRAEFNDRETIDALNYLAPRLDPKANLAAINLYKSNDPISRAIAVHALGYFDDQTSEFFLKQSLNDSETNVRLAGIYALAKRNQEFRIRLLMEHAKTSIHPNEIFLCFQMLSSLLGSKLWSDPIYSDALKLHLNRAKKLTQDKSLILNIDSYLSQ